MARSATFSDLSYGAVSRVQLVISEGTDLLSMKIAHFYESTKLLHIARYSRRELL